MYNTFTRTITCKNLSLVIVVIWEDGCVMDISWNSVFLGLMLRINILPREVLKFLFVAVWDITEWNKLWVIFAGFNSLILDKTWKIYRKNRDFTFNSIALRKAKIAYNFGNPIALRKAKIAYNFGLSECNRVKCEIYKLLPKRRFWLL